MTQRVWSGLLALLLMWIAGCATVYPPAPATTVERFSGAYLIGPGDSLNVVVWRNPEVSMVVPVRPDGKITTPLVEDLQASGKTANQLARDIETALTKYIQNPVVTVIIQSFVGPYSEQIRVIGEAAKPQALPYRDNMTLLDVMIAVGGITDFAAGNRASILRGGNERFGVRLVDLIKGGDLTANVAMRPGDVVVIPQSFF
jgi:polysaccharide export outer membrane protein